MRKDRSPGRGTARSRAGTRKREEASSPAVGAERETHTHRVVLILVFGLLAMLSLRQVGSLDVGFHLKTGEYILSGHWPPRTDPFSFTMRTHEWTDMSWGYDVAVALAHRTFGASGLVVMHTLLVVAIFAVVYLTAKLGGADPTSLVVLLLLGGLASEMRFEARPELLSYLYLSVVLYLLHRHAEGRRSPLWCLPILFLLWANSHSLFVVGWAALAAFLAGLMMRGRSLDLGLLGWSAASVAVAVVNPYGLRGFLFPLSLATRFQEENVFKGSIGEFVSPFKLGLFGRLGLFGQEASQQFPFYPRVPILAFQALFVLSVLALYLLFRQRRYASLLLWAGVSVLAFKMIRNLPIFVVAGLPGIVWGLPAGRILAGLGANERRRRAIQRVALAVAACVAVVLSLRVAHDAYYIASRRLERFGTGWNRLDLPIDAVRHADRAGLHGPVLNHLNFGGYLMWARRDPVFIDGRLEVVGEAFYNEYRNALASQAAFDSCVARYKIRWIVFPYAMLPELLGRLSRDANWRLDYVDHLAAIFVNAGPAGAATADPEPGLLKSEPAQPIPVRSLPRLDGRAYPTRLTRWLRGIVHTEPFPSEDFNLGLFHIYRGEPERAAALFERAIERSGGAYYEIYSNLGAALFRARRLAEARDCYRVVLEERPGDPLARDRIATIERSLSHGQAPGAP